MNREHSLASLSLKVSFSYMIQDSLKNIDKSTVKIPWKLPNISLLLYIKDDTLWRYVLLSISTYCFTIYMPEYLLSESDHCVSYIPV